MLIENQPDVRRWDFAGPVERAYELAKGPVNMIVGPTGGGKSTGSARRCLRVATWQHPSPKDGKRKAKILCICPTYRRAWDTVIPSFLKVFPESLKCLDGSGGFKGSRGDPADHIFEIVVSIGGQRSVLHVEVLFRAVNDLDIEDFFRGFEVTAIWLPEADTNGDLDNILSLGSNRVGRYPEPDDRPEGAEAAYKGIFGDANAPMIGTAFHRRFYLRRMADGSRAPDTDRLFRQPGGFSANAENMMNLRKIDASYYANMAAQLQKYDVGRLIDNKPGYGRHGQPVHPNFDQDTHVATRSLEVDPFSPVYIGVDCGSNALIPAASFSQRTYAGQWRTHAELHLEDGQMNTQQLGESIVRILNARYGAMREKRAVLCLDPAANGGNAASEYTTAQLLQAYTQIETQLAPSNDPRHRRTAVDRLFTRMVGAREPAKIIDPDCQGLIQGYAGGFHYKRRGQTLALTPEKNRYSHVCEADEYAALTIEGLEPDGARFIRPEGEGHSLQGPQGVYAG